MACISACALSRLVSLTSWMQSGEMSPPRALFSAATMAAAECQASLPLRKTTALPLFSASAAASEVTFGRLS